MNVCLFVSTETNDLISACIRAKTGCAWSHVGFYDRDSKLTFSAMADGKGVAWRPVKSTQKMLLLEADGTEAAFQWALQQIGKPYDWRAILGIALDRNILTDGHFFCMYLVFESFVNTANALLATWAIPSYHLSPRDLLLSPKITKLEV